MQRFEGKVALVTGAASGIGRASAVRLGREGARVLLADINQEGLADTAAAIGSGAQTHNVLLDVTDSVACQRAVDSCIEHFGRLDVLCNIAGIAMCQHMAEITDEQWRRMVAINLDGVFYMCRAAIPHLIASKGNIVNMSSSAGLVGQAYNSAYCATKAGVLMFGKALALEYAKQGVRVNSVCPGAVNTPLTDAFKFPEGADMKLLERLFPLIQSSEPEEIAAAVAYLASEESRFITGIALPIDGAQTAG
jgi:meso-butanediol dehydrogenase/(S,S)-butanediol dehydrogenase/diacetyl reductase